MKIFINLMRIVLGVGIFTYIHVELCKLMGIHTRSRNLDRASPVEVEMTEIIGQLLNSFLQSWRVIVGYIEMSW